MLLMAAVCGLRIGEVTALKVSSLDFKRKLIHITGALDYATRKEGTPKSDNSAAPVCMSQLLTKHLRDWLDKRDKANLGLSLHQLQGQALPVRQRREIRSSSGNGQTWD